MKKTQRTQLLRQPHAEYGNKLSGFSGDCPAVCHRCKGLLVREFCFDLHNETGENGFWSLRCLQCGELIDPLILLHRIKRLHPVLTRRSRQRTPVALS